MPAPPDETFQPANHVEGNHQQIEAVVVERIPREAYLPTANDDGATPDPDLSKIKALVFDCDGTLVNSMDYFWKGWQTLCTKYGLNFTEDRFYSLAGRPIKDIVNIVLNETDGWREKVGGWEGTQEEYVEEFIRQKFEIVKEKRDKGIFPTEVTNVTQDVKKWYGKIPMAVASSGCKVHVEEDLKYHDLFKYFDAVITCEDVPKNRGKPEPDLFLLACKAINMDPKDCRGYEDADLGVESLQRAGFGEIVDVRKIKGYPA